MNRVPVPLLGAAMAAALSAPLAAQTRFDLTEVAWTMRPDPEGASIAMEMRLDPLHDRERLLVRMPWWRPGSYRYADFHRDVSGLRAVDHEGRTHAVEKLDPRTWQVDARGAASLTVRYELAVDDSAGPGEEPSVHLHGPGTFLYVEDALRLPHTLSVELPAGWDFASGHRRHPHRDGVRYSPNYDVFADCPMVLGEMERHGFTSHGVPFEVVLFGKDLPENVFDRKAWVRKVRAISEATREIMGEYPFERYVYLFGFEEGRPGGYGLEHLNSTSIVFNAGMVERGMLDPLESVTAHEFFHLWNVKRIRPEALGPFDYSSDVRTRDLWWMEGITSYYNDVILQRAGLRDDREHWFLDSQARNRRNLVVRPGYGVVSPERASWEVWDGENRISYYDQGQALGWLLDVQIRHHTGNRRSLDDVMRVLNRWVDYPDPGLARGELERMVHAVSGWDCAEFFDRYVSGTAEFPYEEVLPLAGLKVTSVEAGEPYLGLRLLPDMTVMDVGEHPLLEEGDRLVAIAGKPVQDFDAVRAVTAGLEPGSEISLRVLRDGKAVNVPWTVRARERSAFQVRPDPDAPEDARAIHEGILRGVPEPV